MLYLCDEYKKIHMTALSRFLYFQQIRIKTGNGQRPYSSRKSVLYTENSYDVACLNFGFITLGPNSAPDIHNDVVLKDVVKLYHFRFTSFYLGIKYFVCQYTSQSAITSITAVDGVLAVTH